MKQFLLVLLATAFTLWGYGQQITNDKVPPAVGKAFRARFAAAQQDSWRKTGDVYTAVFYNGKLTQSATFDATGNWLQTQTELQVKEVPKAVLQTVSKQFAGFEWQEIYRSEKPTGIAYEITVFKGTENYLLEISDKGDVLNKTAGD